MPGIRPDKWLRRWRERVPEVDVRAECVDRPVDALRRSPLVCPDPQDADDGAGFDVVFVREPDDAPRSAPEGLLRIPLYTETMAVLATRDHAIGAFDEVDSTDLDSERWLDPIDAVDATAAEVRAAVDLVAAGVGLLVLPQPYARHLSRRDVVVRPLTGVPATRIGIAWAAEREGEELIDEFVGIVRGRTANSSRGRGAPERSEAGVVTGNEGTGAAVRGAGRDADRGSRGAARTAGGRGAGGRSGPPPSARRPGGSGSGGRRRGRRG